MKRWLANICEILNCNQHKVMAAAASVLNDKTLQISKAFYCHTLAKKTGRGGGDTHICNMKTS